MDGVGGVGDICTSGTNRGNDDEWLHHRLGQVTGVYFTYQKIIFAEVSKIKKYISSQLILSMRHT